jgi:carboxyl-terminal processing protease
MKRGVKALVAAVVVIALMTASFFAGALYSGLGGAVPVVSSFVGSGGAQVGVLTDQVDKLIQQDALVPSSESSIVAGAIGGMLGSLDDTYAAYYEPQDYVELQSSQSGEFYGVGLAVGLNKDGQPFASSVFAGSPADKAGIKAGDVFTAVNSMHKAQWDLQDFVDTVRGPAGTTVALQVTRAGRAPFSVTLTRARVAVPNTTTKMYGDVGYVRLMTFNDLSAADLSAAIKGFAAKGAKGYILDLRQNPGGLLVSAVDVVSLFVKAGVAVRIDERGVPEEVESVSGGVITTKPLVVLVDGGSASASEIVTGALKDYARATIVGEKTYGKGSVQSVLPIANGGAVKMTIAHYLTPLRNVINGVGITPDVVVPMDPKLQLDEKTDTQLAKALAVLRSKL